MGKKKERWRRVPGYKGYYKVSNLGRVKSVDRIVTGRNGKDQHRRGRFYTPQPMPGSYLRVSLSKAGKSREYGIHQLVMMAFVGPCPKDLMCCHDDGNPANNRLSNLRYDTNSSNQMDRHRHGTAATGMANHNSLLTNKQVVCIRKLYNTGDYTYKRLGKKFGVDLTTVGDVVRCRTYKNVGPNGEELSPGEYKKHRKGWVGKKLTAFGRTLTVTQWSEETGLDRYRILIRLSKGWSVERTLSEPLWSAQTYTVFGKTLTIAEWAKEQGIREGLVRNRIRKGWHIKKVLTKPVSMLRKRRRRKRQNEMFCPNAGLLRRVLCA